MTKCPGRLCSYTALIWLIWTEQGHLLALSSPNYDLRTPFFMDRTLIILHFVYGEIQTNWIFKMLAQYAFVMIFAVQTHLKIGLASFICLTNRYLDLTWK